MRGLTCNAFHGTRSPADAHLVKVPGPPTLFPNVRYLKAYSVTTNYAFFLSAGRELDSSQFLSAPLFEKNEAGAEYPHSSLNRSGPIAFWRKPAIKASGFHGATGRRSPLGPRNNLPRIIGGHLKTDSCPAARISRRSGSTHGDRGRAGRSLRRHRWNCRPSKRLARRRQTRRQTAWRR